MIQNNITFESVKTTGFGISSKPVVFKENGLYSPGTIDNFGGIINAVDIDWNKAILENNIKIETTGELLTYVSNIYNKLNELKNIPVLKSFNINNDSTINLYPNAANVNYKTYNSSLELTIKDLNFYTNATATLNDLQFSYTYDDVITFNNSVITGVKNGSTSFNVKYVGNKTLGYASPFELLQKTININSSYLIEKIEINDINEDIYINSSVALSINYTPADKIKEDFKNVVWSVKHNNSDEINAATISNDGKLKVNHNGSVTVTASHNNLISTSKTFNVQTTDAFISILTDGTKQDFINTTYTEEPQVFTIIVDDTSNNYTLDEIQWVCTENAGIEIIETNLDKIRIKITKAVQNARVSAIINSNSIHGACSDFITINVEKATQTIGTNELNQQLTYNESFKVNTDLAKGAITYDYDNTKLSVDTNGNVKAISGTGSTPLKIKADATENYKAAEQTITIELQKATQRIVFNSNTPSSSIDISDNTKYDFSVNGAKTNVYYTITTLSNNDGINYAEKIAWFWGTVSGGELTSINNGLIKAHAYGKFTVTAYAEETDNYSQSEILVSNEITINRIIVNSLTIYADYKSSDGFYDALYDDDDFTITEDISNMPILYISSRSGEVTYCEPPINFEWEVIEGNVDLVQINENIQEELMFPISSLIRLNVNNPGKVTIKCSFKNHWKYELSENSENTITINFLPINASITTSVDPTEIIIGENSQITVVDTAAEKRNNYIYTAHDTHITINESGKITGNASCDNCVITVTSPAKGKYAETSTTTSIKINKKTQNVSVNNINVTYNAPTTTTYSGVKDGARVTWSTTSSLFTINESTGLITPKSGTGSAQATMRVEETTNYYPIEKPFTVTLEKASQTITSNLNGTLTVDAGDTRTFNISGANTSINYTTSDNQIAEINTNGNITFKSSGSVILTAQAISNDNYNASNTITINVTVNKIDGSLPTITNTETSLNVDDPITLTYSDPYNRSLKTFNISGVQYTDLGNNTIKVTSAGDLKISVTVNSNGTYTEATSTEKTIPVNRINQPDTVAISGNGSVDVNSSTTLRVINAEEEPDIIWTSSDNTTATVNTNGDVSGIKGGEVTITATIGETRKYNRTTKTLKVTVNKASVTLKWGEGCEPENFAYGSDGYADVIFEEYNENPTNVKYTSSNTGVASVSSWGTDCTLQWRGEGTTTISAVYEEDEKYLSSSNTLSKKITVSKADVWISQLLYGSSSTYTDNSWTSSKKNSTIELTYSIQPVFAPVVFTSDNTSVAKVKSTANSKVTVELLSKGSAHITADVNNSYYTGTNERFTVSLNETTQGETGNYIYVTYYCDNCTSGIDLHMQKFTTNGEITVNNPSISFDRQVNINGSGSYSSYYFHSAGSITASSQNISVKINYDPSLKCSSSLHPTSSSTAFSITVGEEQFTGTTLSTNTKRITNIDGVTISYNYPNEYSNHVRCTLNNTQINSGTTCRESYLYESGWSADDTGFAYAIITLNVGNTTVTKVEIRTETKLNTPTSSPDPTTPTT